MRGISIPKKWLDKLRGKGKKSRLDLSKSTAQLQVEQHLGEKGAKKMFEAVSNQVPTPLTDPTGRTRVVSWGGRSCLYTDDPRLNLFEARLSSWDMKNKTDSGAWVVKEEFLWSSLAILCSANPYAFAKGQRCVSFFDKPSIPRMRKPQI